MPLDKVTQGNTLRHLNYDIQGLWQNAQGGQSLAYGGGGYRYFGAYGRLLYKMNQMAPDEEARLTGRAYGAIGYIGPNPAVGSTVTVTVTSPALATPISVTVTVKARGADGHVWTNLTTAGAVAQALTLVPAFNAAGFMTIADYGIGPFSNQKVGCPITSIIAPECETLGISVSYTGFNAPQVIVTGKPLAPFLSFNDGTGVKKIYGYLPILDYLESADGSETFTISATAVNGVALNPSRLEDRAGQYLQWQKKTANFLGIPLNKQAAEEGAGSVTF